MKSKTFRIASPKSNSGEIPALAKISDIFALKTTLSDSEIWLVVNQMSGPQ